MMIKDFDFTSIHAVRKQCWTYKADGNTPIRKGKNLYPLEVILDDDTFKGFFVEIIQRKYDYPWFQLWNDLGNSCTKDNGIHPCAEINRLEEEMQGWQSYVGIEGFKRNLHEIEEKHGWINNACIMALTDNGETELAIHYQEYHDRFKTDGKSIVLCLMDKYGIKVPIKTQGWFNQKLAFVKWLDGKITYSYYRTKGTNGSQTAFKYLNMLEEAVNAA